MYKSIVIASLLVVPSLSFAVSCRQDDASNPNAVDCIKFKKIRDYFWGPIGIVIMSNPPLPNGTQSGEGGAYSYSEAYGKLSNWVENAYGWGACPGAQTSLTRDWYGDSAIPVGSWGDGGGGLISRFMGFQDLITVGYSNKYTSSGTLQCAQRNEMGWGIGWREFYRCPVAAKSYDYKYSGSTALYPVCYNPICPSGQKWVTEANANQGKCVKVLDTHKDPDKTCKGNPIYPLNGIKREVISSAPALSGMTSLDFAYDSGQGPWGYDQVNGPFLAANAYGVQPGETPLWGDLGKLWWLKTHRRAQLSPNNNHIRLSRGDGISLSFNLNAGVWETAANGSRDKLTAISSGYRYVNHDGLYQDVYDATGKLSLWQRATGMKATAAYSNGNLQSLTDPFGRQISFTYKTLASGDVVIDTITDSAQKTIIANYDAAANLSSLTWQDSTVRTFLYDSPNANQWWALTGVVGEDAKRYSTFHYDANGWAKSTEHAGGVNKYEVTYDTPPKPVVREVFDAANDVVWRHHEWLAPTNAVVIQPNGDSSGVLATAVMGQSGQAAQGAVRNAGTTQAAGAGCAASSSNTAYDSVTGNVLSQDDFNSKRVCYGYDSANRESARIEGLNGGSSGTSCSAALSASNVATLTPEARKISTEWHPDWKLETRRAEPGRITTWVYNGRPDPFNGGAIASCTSPMYGATSVDPLPDGKPIAVLCKQVIQSTTDVNGSQGFSATLQTQDPAVVWPQVTSRTTSYTYNQFGQVLTSTDERGQVTTNTYYTATTSTYTKGDLWKVTNALGHVTEYTQYNPHGQVLQVLDPNGVATSYTYDLRQRLTSVTQAGQLTQIDWWPTGLLKKVTQPDGSFLAYTYDDAHRLTDIADNLGNAVHYELDNAGNRKKEQVKDSSGVLTRQIDRNYDALNRLWKTSTGAPM